jgi:hypothetical protein
VNENGNSDRRRYEQLERTRRDKWEENIETNLKIALKNDELIKEELSDINDKITDLTVELAVIKTKVAVGATLGGLAGGAFASIVAGQLGG